MSGTIYQITPKRTFDFASVTSGSSVTIPLVRALDVKDAKDLQLIVRVHSANISANAGNAIDIYVDQVSLTSEEPDADFVGVAVGSSVQLASGMTTPLLKVGLLTSQPYGHMVRVRMVGARAGTNLSATVSIDLIARDN
jgi:hypothetical protein